MCQLCQHNQINPEYEVLLHGEDEFYGEISSSGVTDIVNQVAAQLNRHFTSSSDPELHKRRKELRRLFTTVAPGDAKALHDRLLAKADAFSKLFWYKLSDSTCNEMMGILRSKFSGTVTPSAPISPTPSPSPTPASGGVASEMVRIAKEEWQKWDSGRKVESDPAMHPILFDYWKTGTGLNIRDHKRFWSAAFVSWVAKKAGAGRGFRYSGAHTTYVYYAKQNALNNVPDSFKAYRVTSLKPLPGDIVVRNRAGFSYTYDNVRADKPGTHGDIVITVNAGTIEVIGGNKGNANSGENGVTVNKATIRLTNAGYLDASRGYFAILRPDYRSAITPSIPIPPPLPAPVPVPSGLSPLTPSGIRLFKSLLPYIQKHRGTVPLNLALGWIRVESGGQISSHTSLDERGYFQIHPAESKQLSLDHKRLSTDPDYSISAGLALIKYYATRVQRLGYTEAQDIFWKLVKFYHAIGSGSLKIIFDDIRASGSSIQTWDQLKSYLAVHAKRLMSQNGLRFDPPRFILNVEKVIAYGDLILRQLQSTP